MSRGYWNRDREQAGRQAEREILGADHPFKQKSHKEIIKDALDDVYSKILKKRGLTAEQFTPDQFIEELEAGKIQIEIEGKIVELEGKGDGK